MKKEAKLKLLKKIAEKRPYKLPFDKIITITVEKFIEYIDNDTFVYLEYNRTIDEEWVDNIVEKQIEIYEKLNRWHFPDILLLILMPDQETYGFFDSQHRAKAIQKLYQTHKESISSYELSIRIYQEFDHLNLMFEIANTRLNVNSSILMTIKDITDEELVKDIELNSKCNLLVQKLENHFGKIFQPGTHATTCHPYLLKQSFIFEFKKNYKKNNVDDVFNKLCEENLKVKKYMETCELNTMKKRINRIDSVFKKDPKFYLCYYNIYLASEGYSASNLGNCKWIKIIL